MHDTVGNNANSENGFVFFCRPLLLHRCKTQMQDRNVKGISDRKKALRGGKSGSRSRAVRHGNDPAPPRFRRRKLRFWTARFCNPPVLLRYAPSFKKSLLGTSFSGALFYLFFRVVLAVFFIACAFTDSINISLW